MALEERLNFDMLQSEVTVKTTFLNNALVCNCNSNLELYIWATIWFLKSTLPV